MANAISYTGVYSFPYPLGSDDISSGAARLQALAERMEAVLVDAGIEIGTYDVLKTSTVFAGDITGLYNALQIGANTITSVELADNSVDSAAIVAGAVTTVKLGVVDLPNGSTATTQSQLDGSTNVATTSYVDLAAYNIVIGTLPPDSIVNSMVNSAAAISYSKLNLTGTIVNADINASAAIDKTKISGTAVTVADTGTVTSTMILDGTILNADVNASAGIAYSKLNLGTSIVNADVSASAAIAYSKLALTGAILNADLAGSIDPAKVTGTAVVTADSRLTDARTPTGAAGGVLSGTYPNPGFAVDMATQSELDTHASDTTSVHGIADTSVLATATDVSTAVSTHSSDTTSVHGIADTSVLATATDVSTAVSTHSSDTTSVHGITDTANLVLTSDSRLTDARTPTSHAGTHVPGGTDVLDYTKIVGYGTALPTWSATTHPAGVLWVVNTVGEPYSLYRSDGVSAWKQVGGGGASVTASDTAPSSPTSGALWFDSTTGKTFIWYVDGSSNQWVEVGEASQLSIPTHGSSHVRGGSDIIDGDRVTIDYVPTNYTRNAAASGAGDVTDLAANLSGIDNSAFYKTSSVSSGEAATINVNTKPWNLPWGYVTSLYMVNNIDNIGTSETTAITLSVSEINGRRYRFYWNVFGQKEGSQGTVIIKLKRAGTTQQFNTELYSPSDYTQSGAWLRSNDSTGSVSYTLTVQYSANTLNRIYGSGANGASTYLIVEDIGPV